VSREGTVGGTRGTAGVAGAVRPTAPDPNGRWSVVVCAYTWDRFEQTVRCVEAALAQPAAPEVVLVTDHNDPLADALGRRLPNVSVVANSQRPGLGGARNSGVAAASHELVAFVDDDAEPMPGWIAELEAAFADPDVVAVGGEVAPAWEGRQPGWFPPEFLWVVGCSYRGMARGAGVRNPLGCNMAFRRADLVAVGGFDQALGRLGNVPFGLEETELCVRLGRARPGATIVIVDGAHVRHHVPLARQRFGYFLRRCYYEGVGKALLGELETSAALSSERSYALRVLPAAALREVARAVTLDRPSDRVRRAAAIVAGLGAAGAGYGRGRFAGVAAGVRAGLGRGGDRGRGGSRRSSAAAGVPLVDARSESDA
jgi:glucosyl-dolichyl phosphate glucuronosyltransferase